MPINLKKIRSHSIVDMKIEWVFAFQFHVAAQSLVIRVFKQAESNLFMSWNCQSETVTNANGGIGVSL